MTLRLISRPRRRLSKHDTERASQLAREAGIALDVAEGAVQQLAQLAFIAKLRLRNGGAKAQHATLDLEKFEPVLRAALHRLSPQSTKWLRSLGLSAALRAALAAVCDALSCPIRFVGGCDDARGLDASGAEWPRIARDLMGCDSYSGRWLRKLHTQWEADGKGFRVNQQEERPGGFVCPQTGRTFEKPYIRNAVYLTADEAMTWLCVPELRELRDALRDVMPLWAYYVTQPARAWRKHGLTYRDTLCASRDDVRQIAARRAETKRTWKWRRRNDKRRVPKSAHSESTKNVAASPSTPKVPITSSAPSGQERSKRLTPLEVSTAKPCAPLCVAEDDPKLPGDQRHFEERHQEKRKKRAHPSAVLPWAHLLGGSNGQSSPATSQAAPGESGTGGTSPHAARARRHGQ